MAETRILDDDIIRLYELDKPRSAKNLIATLLWGDSLRVTGRKAGQHVVELSQRVWNPEAMRYETRKRIGVLPPKTRFREDRLLKVRVLDVGQGDAAMVETPRGRLVLIDGGEEEHLRHYINVAFSHVLRTRPLHADAIVVTHGDADHFAGLTLLVEGFRRHDSPLITANRVFHNGLVRATVAREKEAFGKTVTANKVTYAVELEDNLLNVPDERMNRPFLDWKKALARLKQDSGGLTIRRLQYGDDEAFGFLASEGITAKVLGPIVEDVGGKPGLRFLRDPDGGGLSASHTINGHSIVLRLTYRNVRFLFGADLNQESEERLLERAREDNLSLTAEVLKVPHHGSADFSPGILEAIRPVVSVVSSGDESVLKEYIHPRAGLIGALGKYSRVTVGKPLVYATEMVAFFERLGLIHATEITPDGKEGEDLDRIPNAYRKRAFGIVHVRTDGERVLVATHSGREDQKESYAFRVDERGQVTFEPETRII
jgi:beta-lactamase superfamily II metal-dependent hydrolase